MYGHHNEKKMSILDQIVRNTSHRKKPEKYHSFSFLRKVKKMNDRGNSGIRILEHSTFNKSNKNA